jgi:hypothetical protein
VLNDALLQLVRRTRRKGTIKSKISEVFENNLSIQTHIRCMPPKNISANHGHQLQSCDFNGNSQGNSHSRKRKIFNGIQ